MNVPSGVRIFGMPSQSLWACKSLLAILALTTSPLVLGILVPFQNLLGGCKIATLTTGQLKGSFVDFQDMTPKLCQATVRGRASVTRQVL